MGLTGPRSTLRPHWCLPVTLLGHQDKEDTVSPLESRSCAWAGARRVGESGLGIHSELCPAWDSVSSD